MAKTEKTQKYEYAEKVTALLGEDRLGGLQKRLIGTERNLSEILKKLSAIEAEKERIAAAQKEEAARAEAEQKAAQKVEEAVPLTLSSGTSCRSPKASETI